MSTMKIEIQDHEGNVYHPHTDAKVVFMPDGKTVEATLLKINEELNGVRLDLINTSNRIINKLV